MTRPGNEASAWTRVSSQEKVLVVVAVRERKSVNETKVVRGARQDTCDLLSLMETISNAALLFAHQVSPPSISVSVLQNHSRPGIWYPMHLIYPSLQYFVLLSDFRHPRHAIINRFSHHASADSAPQHDPTSLLRYNTPDPPCRLPGSSK